MSQPDYDDEPVRDESGERHRLLGNSFMLGANSGRYSLQLPFTSGLWSVAQSQAVQLVAWQTGESEPQELELLVYPMTLNEGSAFANEVNVEDFAMLVLTRSANAHRGRAGGVSYDTLLSIPTNGLRMRFAAVSAVLRVMNIGPNPLNITLSAGIYPVSGSNRDEEACISFHSGQPAAPLPKGARAWRAVPGVSETSASAQFYDFGGTALTSIAVSTATAWLPIPRGAYSVQVVGSNYAGAGNKVAYYASLFFQ